MVTSKHIAKRMLTNDYDHHTTWHLFCEKGAESTYFEQGDFNIKTTAFSVLQPSVRKRCFSRMKILHGIVPTAVSVRCSP